MKAIAKLRAESGAMSLIDLPEPAEAEGRIKLKILAGGICGTDVAIWKWHGAVVGQYAPSFPLIVGHEFAGMVVSRSGTRVQCGDIVAVNPQIACGTCHYCGLGRPTLCEDRRLMGGRINGGWTEYVSVPEQNLYVLPKGVDAAVAPLLEPLSVATHAVLERVPVHSGDVVAIIGAGPIGVLCAILALQCGASKVMITGLQADASRLELAQRLGAIAVNVESEDALARVRSLQRDGADVVYETSGAAITLDQSIGLARRGGSVGLIGLCHGPSQVLSTPIVLRELAIVGSRGYNETTWALMMRNLPVVVHSVLQLITHELPYADFETALNMVQNRQGSKIILRPDV